MKNTRGQPLSNVFVCIFVTFEKMLTPPLIMQAFQLCKPFMIVHPLSREAPLLQLCNPPFSWEMQKKIQFWHKKVPFNYAPPRPAKRRPFNYAGAKLLGEGLREDKRERK